MSARKSRKIVRFRTCVQGRSGVMWAIGVPGIRLRWAMSANAMLIRVNYS